MRRLADSRTMHASRFRVFCLDAGLSYDEVAKLLHVTPRTVRYWISGETTIPYAAYRLLRILRSFELPPPFQEWRIHSGKLWTPEGLPIEPRDGSWWSSLVRQARLFRQLYDREAALRVALQAAGRSGPATGGAAGGPPAPAQTVPTGEAGRAAQPPGPNLFLEHFGTENLSTASVQPPSLQKEEH